MDRRVEEAIGAQLRYCAGNRRRIARRLRELDEEWDLESVLESNASIVTALGVIAGAVVNRRVPSVPVSWAASLVRLAANGLLPLEPLLRRLGLRTSREIEIERMALTIMRGDLERAPASLAGRRTSDSGIRVVRH
ncbi:hypothetical protein [Reyranella sp.]|uniref:hypothetical protein n=1 Tax=Reyranella sp. TaxID=1929291 RepID=UPI003BAC3B77